VPFGFTKARIFEIREAAALVLAALHILPAIFSEELRPDDFLQNAKSEMQFYLGENRPPPGK
jgi:hypothetical protein